MKFLTKLRQLTMTSWWRRNDCLAVPHCRL